MSRQQGYTIVDVDEEEGDVGRLSGSNLEFKTFANTPSTPYEEVVASSSRRGTAADGSSPLPAYSMFNLTYYQYLFDVDTFDIIKRTTKAMFPITADSRAFLVEVCEGRGDLYGPFWTLTTLAFTLYVFSSLSSSISSYLTDPDVPPVQNISQITLAAGIVYSYGFIWPAILWGITRWFGGADVPWSIVDAWVIYGYAMSIYVPISAICFPPIPVLRWILVLLGALSSGFFLIQNIYPVLASLDSKLPRLLVIAVVALHAIIALLFKLLFFSYSVGGKTIGPDVDIPGLSGGGTAGNGTIEALSKLLF